MKKKRKEVYTLDERMPCGNTGTVVREIIKIGREKILKETSFCSLCGEKVRTRPFPR